VDPKNNVYVTDMENSRIQKFDSDGNFITMWGSKGSNEGEMNKPEDIAINPNNNNVYVTDTKNSRIIEFTLKR
jgi:DNA-binding beta-propeller fold protein YncE